MTAVRALRPGCPAVDERAADCGRRSGNAGGARGSGVRPHRGRVGQIRDSPIGAEPSSAEARLIAVDALRRLSAPARPQRSCGGQPRSHHPGIKLEQGYVALEGDLNAAATCWEQYLHTAPPTAADAAGIREALVSLTFLRGFLEAHSRG